MKSIRERVILLACWLVGFGSLAQLLEPINISEVTYLFVLAMMIFVFVAPHLARIPLWMLLSVPVPIFIGIKIWMGAFVGTTAVLLTIAEIGVIGLTTFLAYRVSVAIGEFENAVAHVTIGHGEQVTDNSSLGASCLYREVRRARNHQRPLSLMAVAIDEESLKLDLDRIVQEAQRAMMMQYALSSVSKLLCEKLEDCDLIVQSNGHFLVLLPETTPDDLPGLVERLRLLVLDQVGVELKIGAASLPRDSYTLDGLIEQATRGMKTNLASEFLLDLERVPLEHHTS